MKRQPVHYRNHPKDVLYGLIPWVQAADAHVRQYPKDQWKWRLSQALDDGSRTHNSTFMDYAAWALQERLFRSRADLRSQQAGAR